MKRLLFITLFLYLSNLLLAQLPNITKVEYYIDTDPGYGLATNASTISSDDLDFSFIADVSNLAEGMHKLFVRAKDENNNWSFTKSQTFFKGFGIINETIDKVEYYFDTDPGYGNATPFSFNPVTDVEITVNLDVSSLENGIHNLFIRAQDKAGQWTTTKSHTFYKGIFSNGTAAKIKTVEYYIDNDPGLGNGKKVAFTADTELDLTFDADLMPFTEGCHDLYIRAQDENESWSLITKHPFCINATGILEPGISNILIFPNPANGSFTVQFQNESNKTTLEIVNVIGQVVLTKTYYTYFIYDNISMNGAKGLFLIKLISGDKITVKKLTIK